MNPLYIDSSVASISCDKYSLIIRDKKQNKEIERFKPRDIPYDSIIVQRPNGYITFASFNWIIKHGISLTLLNWRGNILGQFLPEEPISNELKVAQYQTYLDREKHVSIARALVETKIQRQRDLLKSLSSAYPIEIPIIKPINATSEDFIRNQEARFATEYFTQFGIICKELGHDFKGRNITHNNMNAPDLPNGLLNYGYALVQTIVRRALNSIGLDNTIPFLHDMRKNHGLVYDIMELWRTNIDYSVLQCLEQLNAKKRNHYLTDGYEVLLKEESVRSLYDRVKLNLSLEEIILNSRRLANYILGKNQSLSFSLRPLVLQERFEDSRVKTLILSKTARELGINKSTLFYQRQRLIQRGSLRLYGKTKQYFA